LGFFAARSRELVEIPGCLVADPELDRALARLRALFAQHRSASRCFVEAELRVAPSGPRVSLMLTPRAERLEGATALLSALAELFHVSVAGRAEDPESDQRFPLPGGVELRAPAQAFTQVNWSVNRALVQAVLDGAERRAARTFCDLYCGAGNFSLPLLARGLRGVGIEASKGAIAAAKRALTEQRLGEARFIQGDVRAALSQLSHAERFDLMVLDPPRMGAREVLGEIVRRAPAHIAYCACDPVTLARDLRTLCEQGYALDEITGFDMFPQTHHFETLVWLRWTRE
jgi:23S rRNA (uracil1939-C5)-methyltransferase